MTESTISGGIPGDVVIVGMLVDCGATDVLPLGRDAVSARGPGKQCKMVRKVTVPSQRPFTIRIYRSSTMGMLQSCLALGGGR